MKWRWRLWHRNGEAQLAAEQAATALSRAKQQSRRVDQVVQAQDVQTSHVDWFTHSMEQALHRRREA